MKKLRTPLLAILASCCCGAFAQEQAPAASGFTTVGSCPRQSVKISFEKPQPASMRQIPAAPGEANRTRRQMRKSEADEIGRYESGNPQVELKKSGPTVLYKRGSLWTVCEHSASLSVSPPSPILYSAKSLPAGSCLSRALSAVASGYATQDRTFLAKGQSMTEESYRENVLAIAAPSEKEVLAALRHSFDRARLRTLGAWSAIVEARDSVESEAALADWMAGVCQAEIRAFSGR